MTFTNSIHRMIEDLPPDLQLEAFQFIEQLAKKKRKVQRKFSLSWAGGLSELKSSTTSVELQHAARYWRD